MKRIFILIVFLSSISASCVKIPPESVTLSEVVGDRIIAIQTAHENLILDYFQQSRDRIDQFLKEKWIPKFLETFVVDSDIMKLAANPKVLTPDQETKIMEALNTVGTFSGAQLVGIINAINSSMGDAERGAIILDFANTAMEQINLQRLEMMKIIDDREKRVLKEVRVNYNELIELQSTLTAYVRSVHKVVESQDTLLNKIGLLDKRDEILTKAFEANDQLNGILSESGGALDLAKKFLNSTIKSE